MSTSTAQSSPCGRFARAFTLIEVVVVVFVGALLLYAIYILGHYGARTFAAMGNYADLDSRSRLALDTMTREIRQASLLVSFANGATSKALTFTNEYDATAFTFAWDASSGTITFAKAGEPTQTLLTGCVAWNFALYQRTPLLTSTNILYYPATNVSGVLTPSLCKLVDMNWRCARTNFAMMRSQRFNTETVQTAQIVLRNKQ